MVSPESAAPAPAPQQTSRAANGSPINPRSSSTGSLEASLLPPASSPGTNQTLHPFLKSPAPTGKLWVALDVLQFGIIIIAFALPGVLADTSLTLGFIVSISILMADQILQLYLCKKGLKKSWPIRINLAFVCIFTVLLVCAYLVPSPTLRWFQVIQNAASAVFCVMTVLIGNPMIADFGRDESHELLWDHWAFRNICTHLTWAWAVVFAFMALCAGLAMAIPSTWSNILFNYVLQILVSLICIKLSYSYPTYYKLKHQQTILASFPDDVLEQAVEQQCQKEQQSRAVTPEPTPSETTPV